MNVNGLSNDERTMSLNLYGEIDFDFVGTEIEANAYATELMVPMGVAHEIEVHPSTPQRGMYVVIRLA